MSDTPTPVRHSFLPWLGLLIIPLALGIGWLAGQMPVPKSAVRAPGASPAAVAPQHPVTADGVGAATTSPNPVAEPAPQDAQKPEFSEWTTLENAVAESQRNGKPILLDFNADWCGPCQALKREVFNDGTRGPSVQTAVIPVSIVDRKREEGSNPPDIERLQQQFSVTGFPTIVVFSPHNGHALRTVGYGGADQTVAWITQAAQAVR